MHIQTTVVGSYPKPPDEGRPFAVRKTRQSLDKGSATLDDLKKAQDDLVAEIVAEQEAAGIDVITDGQARWDDIVTPFARHMAGFEIGGLLRFFDNNTYYRRPICIDEIEWRGPATVADYQFATSVATKPVKAVIPGPITFARLSVDEHYGNHERFVYAIARVLAQEAFELEAAGAPVIQIDEPALLDAPEDLDLAANAISSIVEGLKHSETKTILCTYFGDAKRLGPQIFELPVDGFGFDLVAGEGNYSLLTELPPEKSLQAGIVDARNTKLESKDELVRTIDELVQTVGAHNLSVSPSAGLEYLPREKTRAKLERLHDAAAAAAEKVGV